MKYSKLILPFLLIYLVFLGCERDDICSENTSTTPKVIIRFYDLSDTETLKSVSGLKVFGIDDEGNDIELPDEFTPSSDSIALPLRTTSDITQFKIYTDYELDTDNNPTGNPDIISINYTREEIYVSRACGFKDIFTNLGVIVQTDEDNWIANRLIVAENNTIENETNAHIHIFH